MKRLLGMVFTAAIAGVAHAETIPSVLGVTLGQPMPYEECKATHSDEEFRARPMCWTKSGIGAAIGEDDRSLQFPNGGPRISYISPAWFHAQIVDGLVAGYWFPTTGISSQDDVIKDLSAKFGKPTRAVSDHLQNRMNARFTGKRVWWVRHGYTVFFDSTDDGLDSGIVKVRTDALAAHEKAQEDAAKGHL